jgi:hypothetical protein
MENFNVALVVTSAAAPIIKFHTKHYRYNYLHQKREMENFISYAWHPWKSEYEHKRGGQTRRTSHRDQFLINCVSLCTLFHQWFRTYGNLSQSLGSMKTTGNNKPIACCRMDNSKHRVRRAQADITGKEERKE